MWAATAASYCPSRAGELSKQNMTKPHERWDGKLCSPYFHPLQSSVHLEVIVIRQDGSVPVKYGLTMEMESRHAAIKPLLARD